MLDTPSPGLERRRAPPAPTRQYEDFGTSDNAGVDEDDVACGDSSKAEAFVDEPPVDNMLHDFGPVYEGVREAGFAFFVF